MEDYSDRFPLILYPSVWGLTLERRNAISGAYMRVWVMVNREVEGHLRISIECVGFRRHTTGAAGKGRRSVPFLSLGLYEN